MDYRILIVISVVSHIATSASQWRIAEIEVFSHSGTAGLLAAHFSLNVMQCRKEVYATCLSKESMLFAGFFLGIPSSHSLPEGSTRFASWLHHVHPFVAAADKNLSHAETQRVWSRSWGLQDLLQCSDCALSHAIRLLQTNDQLSRLRF